MPSRNIRLYRNGPAFRHEGRVHQTVKHAMERAGAAIQDASLIIHQYGFLRTDRSKSAL